MNRFLLFLILFNTVIPVYADLYSNKDQDVVNKSQINDTDSFLWIDSLKDGFDFSGYLRAGYIQTDHSSATALGGELGFSYQFNDYLKAHLGVFSSFDPGVNSDNDDNIQGEFFNSQQDSYLIVGEAFLSLSYEQFHAQLGRQYFASPHMDSDDLRIIPNLFEVYLIDTHLTDQWVLGAGFVREAAGWENGANASQFVSIGEAFGGESSGAWVSWLSYQQSSLSSDSWFYYIPDHLSLFYTELIASHDLSESLSFQVGLQYDGATDTGSSTIGDVDSHTVGVMASVFWADYTLTAAYNKNFGSTAAIASVGGGPFFTSVEDQTLDAVEGDRAQSVMLGVEYHVNEFVDVGVMAGKFSASNKRDYNKEEFNLFINLFWEESVDAELMYAVVDDLNSEPDLHQVRLILTYHY